MKKVNLIILISILYFSCKNSSYEEGNTKQKASSTKIAAIEESIVETNSSKEIIQQEKQSTEPSEKEEIKVEEENINPMKQTEVNKTNQEEVKNEPVKVATITKEPENEIQKELIRPNHEIWDLLTKKYVTSSGKVNYKGFKSENPQVVTYLQHLEKTPPQNDWSSNEKLAYWINLYNASTVYLIISNYPVKSITDINGGKPWDKKFVKSADKTYTLNEIENSIVRPRFNEPRIHVALNCAAKSCPKLLNAAFMPSQLNMQFEKLAKVWINDVTKNKITVDQIMVSKIFEWYGEDFKTSGGIIGFINKYATTKVAEEATITYLAYGWALNE